MYTIRNIIFDYGGVIFNVDYRLTVEAFKCLGIVNFEYLYTQLKQDPLFDSFETGIISPDEFRDALRNKTGVSLSDKQIDEAWNAMLVGLPPDRLTLLRELKSHYRLFLLSNTNAIHLPAVNQIIRNQYGIDCMKDFFLREYYSHLIGMRKPDPAIFKFVLSKNRLRPEETLFIDDNPLHVEEARRHGIIAVHLTQYTDLPKVLHAVLS